MKSKTILFVDDEAYRMQSHVEYLKLKGYDVIYTSEFSEAEETFKRYKDVIDLIILDIMLPIEDVRLSAEEENAAQNGRYAGFILYERLLKHGKVKAIVLSARQDLRGDANERKVEKYLQKPLQPEMLLDAVQELLAEK